MMKIRFRLADAVLFACEHLARVCSNHREVKLKVCCYGECVFLRRWSFDLRRGRH
jgi:hypothetical protein